MTPFTKFKQFFIYSLIGSLILSALVAVVTILTNDFNDTTTKVFLTLGMVVLHAALSLSLIWDDTKRNTFERLALFSNALFVLTVASFATSILGIWKIFPGELVGNLYEAYLIFGFAALHIDILSKTLNKEKHIDMLVRANYVFVAIVVLLLMPVTFVKDGAILLGEMYFRVLSAVAIVDGTLTLLALIFLKLYLQKHPEERSPLFASAGAPVTEHRRGLSGWMLLLVLYLVLQGMIVFFNNLS